MPEQNLHLDPLMTANDPSDAVSRDDPFKSRTEGRFEIRFTNRSQNGLVYVNVHFKSHKNMKRQKEMH